MRNVAGLSTSEAQKSSDLFMKCRYMDELTGNKGVIFATGTPINNSMTEMYTMQRYLQYDTLVSKGLERTRKSLEAKLEKLLKSKKRDDVVTYEQLGVDRLFVDEAHNFKDL
jgi:N12 class adenine-specific DNA methylase